MDAGTSAAAQSRAAPHTGVTRACPERWGLCECLAFRRRPSGDATALRPSGAVMSTPYGEALRSPRRLRRRLAADRHGPPTPTTCVSDAFAEVLLVLQRGGGPDLAFRAYLLTAVRRLHVDPDPVRVPPAAGRRPDAVRPGPAVPGHRGRGVRATRPQPARSPPCPSGGRWCCGIPRSSGGNAAGIAAAARSIAPAAGLRARLRGPGGTPPAFLGQHAADPDDVDCSWTRDHLGAYIRGGLSRRDATRVEGHLGELPRLRGGLPRGAHRGRLRPGADPRSAAPRHRPRGVPVVHRGCRCRR